MIIEVIFYITCIFICNSEISAKRFKELMLNNDQLVTDFGTVLSGTEAVKEKLINEIGGLSDALAYIDKLCN